MDSHAYTNRFSSFDCIIGAGAASTFSPGAELLPQLKTFAAQHQDWLFGHIGYDLKNEIENLASSHTDTLLFPDLFFFIPQTVLLLQKDVLTIETLLKNPKVIYEEIIGFKQEESHITQPDISIRPRIGKEEYLSIIKQLKQHILRGDCYEINFCQEFYAENVQTEPVSLFRRLMQLSPSPFSVYYKLKDKYAFCASPERYLKKEGSRLVSQPIKGTAKRNLLDKKADDLLKQELQNSVKNRTENVMITDLVRNDFSKISKPGSVTVTELFGIYSYPQVHQMISTVEGEVERDINIADVINATFPMGSMTGAPKRKVMELIEQYEPSKRGLYSGSIGYITPENNWDFNVVIRTILYNKTNKYLSFQAGGAITFHSVAEEEYEESLLKAEAMMKAIKEHG